TATVESCNNYHQQDGLVEDCNDDASIIPETQPEIAVDFDETARKDITKESETNEAVVTEEFQDDSSYVWGAPLQQ
ncbi:hypothetical protein A2U01_0080701, partial [Trifolium medium]|nr:hypothetical protein [Trifolium medium]